MLTFEKLETNIFSLFLKKKYTNIKTEDVSVFETRGDLKSLNIHKTYNLKCTQFSEVQYKEYFLLNVFYAVNDK